jgi:hypothetical protein
MTKFSKYIVSISLFSLLIIGFAWFGYFQSNQPKSLNQAIIGKSDNEKINDPQSSEIKPKDNKQSSVIDNTPTNKDPNYDSYDFSACDIKIKYNNKSYTKTDSNYVVESIKGKYDYKSLAEDDSAFIDNGSKNPLLKNKTFLLKQNDVNLSKQGLPFQIYCSSESIPALPFEISNENLGSESLVSLQNISKKLIKLQNNEQVSYGKISNLGGVAGVDNEWFSSYTFRFIDNRVNYLVIVPFFKTNIDLLDLEINFPAASNGVFLSE